MMKITEIGHIILDKYITKDDTLIDMTLGNGNDSLYFIEKVKHIYGFDIQELAINNSKKLLKEYTNITYILDNHGNIDKYNIKYDYAIYNLGYLPNSDKIIKTNYLDTIKSLDILIKNNIKGILLTIYVGHEEGLIESNKIINYLKNITNYDLLKISLENNFKNKPPYILFLKNKMTCK